MPVQLWREIVNYPIPIRPSWWYSLLAIPAALVGIGLFAYFLLWDTMRSSLSRLVDARQLFFIYDEPCERHRNLMV